jgi:ribosome-associated heat shock protein Hsp15
MESTRVDRWLWCVRIFKSRSEATDACRGGHVRVNGNPAKPAAMVRVGDKVEARAHRRERVLEVAKVIDRRVGAPLAVECFVDSSPPPPERDLTEPAFARDPATGRPTKKERRQLDRFRSR